MIEFIKSNYEWIFSGCGVVIILAFWKVISRIFTTPKRALGDELPIPNEAYRIGNSQGSVQISPEPIDHPLREESTSAYSTQIASIDPVILMEELRSAPPYQVEQISSNYVGLRIKCSGEYFYIYVDRESQAPRCDITLRYESRTDILIMFSIDIEQYPILKIAKFGKKFTVVGRIAEIFLPSIIKIHLEEMNESGEQDQPE
jgi:hypothetical protein